MTEEKVKGLELIKSTFWKKVLEVWLNYKNSPLLTEGKIDIRDPIFNNAHITFKSKTVFF